MEQTLFVAGGSGFIGQEICRTAIGAGYEVRALSRRGKPRIGKPWAEMVSWIKGDALEPATWSHQLEGCHAVIHCVGLLREDPLQGDTYERINAEAAITVAGEAEKSHVTVFVMFSAKITPPFIPNRYLESKRHAESQIMQHYQHLRSVFLRPSFVYGRHRPASIAVRRIYQLLNMLRTDQVLPLSVDEVAAVAVYAASGDDVEGIVVEEVIADLAATKAESLRIPGQSGAGSGGFVIGVAVGALALLLLSRAKT